MQHLEGNGTPVLYIGRTFLTLILLTSRIRWALNNASRWQMGFHSAFKGLKVKSKLSRCASSWTLLHQYQSYCSKL